MRTVLASLFALILLFDSAPGRAQDETPINRDIAQKHWELGEKLYQASNYPAALVEFQKAYKLAPRPGMLFNIARCHEVMGDLEEAVKHYERYIEGLPEAKNRGLVKTRITNLKATLASKEKTAPVSAPFKKEPTAVKQEVPPAPAPRSWKRTAGWAGLGAGAALLATGALLGVLAQEKADEYNDETSAGALYRDLREIESSGEALQAAQIATLIAGGVLFTAGAVLVILDRKGQTREQPAASVTVAPYIGQGNFGIAGHLQF